VWEWVQDWYDSQYYAASPATDPKGLPIGQYRVLRGGSCFSGDKFVRTSARYFIGRTLQTDFYGLRVVREKK
jgi:formylglycine-generating enzyme required for sulfatase activity